MDTINLKELWQSQQVAVTPDWKKIATKASELQAKTKRKTIWGNLLLLATLVFIIAIVIGYKPEMATTKIGTLLVIAAIVMMVVASGKVLPLLGKSKADNDAAAYLSKLTELRKKQLHLQTTIMNAYFILLCSGIFLYMIEYTLRMSFAGAVTAYAVTAGWFAFNWFYIRPKTIRKQQTQINGVINELEKIQQQFDEK